MKNNVWKWLGRAAVCSTVLGSTIVLAQPPREGERGERGGERGGERRPEGGFGGPGGGGFGGGRGGRGGPGMFMRLPIMAALDADGNGEISAAEIDGAVAALKKLDKNSDGKLTAEELMPEGGMMGGPGGFGGPGGPGGPGGFGGPGGPGGGFDPAAMVERLMASDQDKDGFLTKSEIPERMQTMLERADADKDGKLSKDELTKAVGQMAEQMRGRGGPEGGREGGRPEGGRGEGERPRRPASE